MLSCEWCSLMSVTSRSGSDVYLSFGANGINQALPNKAGGCYRVYAADPPTLRRGNGFEPGLVEVSVSQFREQIYQFHLQVQSKLR